MSKRKRSPNRISIHQRFKIREREQDYANLYQAPMEIDSNELNIRTFDIDKTKMISDFNFNHNSNLLSHIDKINLSAHKDAKNVKNLKKRDKKYLEIMSSIDELFPPPP